MPLKNSYWKKKWMNFIRGCIKWRSHPGRACPLPSTVLRCVLIIDFPCLWFPSLCSFLCPNFSVNSSLMFSVFVHVCLFMCLYIYVSIRWFCSFLLIWISFLHDLFSLESSKKLLKELSHFLLLYFLGIYPHTEETGRILSSGSDASDTLLVSLFLATCRPQFSDSLLQIGWGSWPPFGPPLWCVPACFLVPLSSLLCNIPIWLVHSLRELFYRKLSGRVNFLPSHLADHWLALMFWVGDRKAVLLCVGLCVWEARSHSDSWLWTCHLLSDSVLSCLSLVVTWWCAFPLHLLPITFSAWTFQCYAFGEFSLVFKFFLPIHILLFVVIILDSGYPRLIL